MKWLALIRKNINNPNITKGSILLMIDMGFIMGELSAQTKAELLAELNVSSYNIIELLDSLTNLFEFDSILDLDFMKLILARYVKIGTITTIKRDELLAKLNEIQSRII